MQRFSTSQRSRSAAQTLWTVAATLLLGSLLVVFTSGGEGSQTPAAAAPPQPQPSCPIATSQPEPPCEEGSEDPPPVPC